MTAPQVAGRLPLAGFYFLYFGTVGIILPFLPPYLRSLGLSTAQVGLLLALTPFMSLIAPPLWGHLADRSGRLSRVLSLLVVGSCLFFAPLLWVESYPALVATLAVYACFASAVTPLVDSLTLNHIARVGGSYASIRLFGSLGFILATTSFGLLAPSVDRLTVLVSLVLLSLLALWSFSLCAQNPPGASPHPLAGLRLLSEHKDLRWLLAATCIHWLACAPYNGMLAIHILALGMPPSVVGLSAGVGVAAEVAVMAAYPALAQRLTPRHLLCLAFAASALRWGGMAFAASPIPLVSLALLHSLTFGLFYVASIAFMARRVPQRLRASGQGLFAAVTFGVGGLVGHVASGAGYALLGGGHALFGVAGLLEVVAAVIVLQASAAPRPETEPIQAPPS